MWFQYFDLNEILISFLKANEISVFANLLLCSLPLPTFTVNQWQGFYFSQPMKFQHKIFIFRQSLQHFHRCSLPLVSFAEPSHFEVSADKVDWIGFYKIGGLVRDIIFEHAGLDTIIHRGKLFRRQ